MRPDHVTPAVPHEPAIPRQRTESPSDASSDQPVCRCTHAASLHEHFRAGTDCALCRCGHYRSSAAFGDLLIGLLRKGR
jgi:hypothetical protein